jgi:hypothetical protein
MDYLTGWCNTAVAVWPKGKALGAPSTSKPGFHQQSWQLDYRRSACRSLTRPGLQFRLAEVGRDGLCLLNNLAADLWRLGDAMVNSGQRAPGGKVAKEGHKFAGSQIRSEAAENDVGSGNQVFQPERFRVVMRRKR